MIKNKVKLNVPVIMDRLPSEGDLLELSSMEGVYIMRQFKAVVEFMNKGYITVTERKKNSVFSEEFQIAFNTGEYEEMQVARLIRPMSRLYAYHWDNPTILERYGITLEDFFEEPIQKYNGVEVDILDEVHEGIFLIYISIVNKYAFINGSGLIIAEGENEKK